MRRLVPWAVLLVVAGLMPGLASAADAASTSGAPFGSLDQVIQAPGGAQVAGWAIDPNTPSPIAVHIYADGHYLEQVIANQPRPDVGAAYPAAGSNHGFTTTIALAPGAHQVCVWAINVGAAAANPELGCKNVSVGGNPNGVIDAVIRRWLSSAHCRARNLLAPRPSTASGCFSAIR